MATPCPGSQGCRCPYCFGMFEWASENLSSTWGLQPAERPVVRIIASDLSVDAHLGLPIQARPQHRQPWHPRPSRHERHRAA